MTYTYVVTEDFKVIVTDSNGDIVNNPGPWITFEEADLWGMRYTEALNNGTLVLGQEEDTD